MRTQLIAVGSIIFIVAGLLNSQSGEPRPSQGVSPKNGFVPDQQTAVRIAEAVLIPIYGEKKIISERPFKVELSGDIWTVTGSLPESGDPNVFVFGGVAHVEISKSKGCIEKIWHTARSFFNSLLRLRGRCFQ